MKKCLVFLICLVLVGCSPSISKWNDSFEGGTCIILEVETKGDPSVDEQNTAKIMEIIGYRLDAIDIRKNKRIIKNMENRRIVIQLPFVKYSQQVVDLVSTSAYLEFKLVSDDLDKTKAALEGNVPPGYELLTLDDKPILLEKKAVLTGDTLTDARVNFSQRTFGEPYVSLTFDNKAGRLFAQITGQNVNKRLAILLDGVVQSAPVIRERIPSGRAQITGRFSTDEAKNLAIILRAGAIPAPLKIIEAKKLSKDLWQGQRNE